MKFPHHKARAWGSDEKEHSKLNETESQGRERKHNKQVGPCKEKFDWSEASIKRREGGQFGVGCCMLSEWAKNFRPHPVLMGYCQSILRRMVWKIFKLEDASLTGRCYLDRSVGMQLQGWICRQATLLEDFWWNGGGTKCDSALCRD